MEWDVRLYACNPRSQLPKTERPDSRSSWLFNEFQPVWNTWDSHHPHPYFLRPKQNKKEHCGSIRHKQYGSWVTGLTRDPVSKKIWMSKQTPRGWMRSSSRCWRNGFLGQPSYQSVVGNTAHQVVRDWYKHRVLFLTKAHPGIVETPVGWKETLITKWNSEHCCPVQSRKHSGRNQRTWAWHLMAAWAQNMCVLICVYLFTMPYSLAMSSQTGFIV